MEKRRILIIDDDKEVCEVMKDMLIAGGYDAFTAFDGNTGLIKAEEEKPDLILLDLMMPGIDGFEVLRKLKSNLLTSCIPIVIVSARRDADSLFKASEMRSSDYLMKPFSSSELIKIVERCFSFFRPLSDKIDPVLAAELKEKIQDASTALNMISHGRNVPSEFLDKALKKLNEVEKILRDAS